MAWPMEMYGEHGDLGKVLALLVHQRIDTTQIYASIRPQQLKRSVEFLKEKAGRMLNGERPKPRFVLKDRSGISEGPSLNLER